MAAEIQTLGAAGGGVMVVKVDGAASTANAGLGSILNPEGVPLLILRATWHILTQSTAAANIAIGITTAAAKGTDILNDLAAGSATGKVYNGHAMQNTAKTEIANPAKWTATTYLTITGSSTSVGMEAYLLLEYVRLAE